MKLSFLKRDLSNIVRFGWGNAPLAAQRIWITPSEVKYFATSEKVSRKLTGSVMAGDWDKPRISFDELEKYQICKRHFYEGLSWEVAGAYSLMKDLLKDKKKVDGCTSFDQVVTRYQKLDDLYQNLKGKTEYKTQSQLKLLNFREKGGVYIHIDRYGQALFGGGGFHRLSIAKILDLPSIPAQLGIVHQQAIESGSWKKLLQPASQSIESLPS